MTDPTKPRGPLRSSVMTKGVDRATHRSLLYSMGWRPEHTTLPKGTLLERYRRLVGPATRGATLE